MLTGAKLKDGQKIKKTFTNQDIENSLHEIKLVFPSVSLSVPSLKADGGEGEGGDRLQWLRDSVPGEPGVDYPILSQPQSSTFSCSDRVFGGYYADTEQGCQVFHICLQDSKVSMICPNGTVFAQVRDC